MSDELFTRPNSYLLYAIGTSLTAWRNGDAKLVTAELKEVDNLLDLSSVGKPLIQNTSKTPIGFLRHEVHTTNKAKKNGDFKGIFDFQTGRIINWFCQNCSTTENTPAGYNTHAMSIKDGQTPQNIGIHVQRETTSDPQRNDLLGLIPTEYRLALSEDGEGQQEITFNVAKFLPTASCDDITKPSKCSDQSYTWDNLKAGGITFNYGGSSVGFNVTGIEILLTQEVKMFAKDSEGFATLAINKKAKYTIKLTGTPNDGGASIFTMNDTEPSDYTAGGIDIVLKFQRHITNDFVQFTYNNVKMTPFENKVATEDAHVEEYELEFTPHNDGSLAISAVDSYNNDYYENP